MKRSTVVAAAAIAAGVVAVVLVAGTPVVYAPLSPQSPQPQGVEALVDLMDALGSPVTVLVGKAPAPPSPGYALVLSDSSVAATGELSTGQRRELATWVAWGGQLVIADPQSRLVSLFADDPGHVEVEEGPGIFTNAELGSGDNAARAGTLLGAGSHEPVYIVYPPVAPAGTRTVWSMFDLRTRLVLGGLALAVLLWCLARARRFGAPVEESPIVAVEGSVTIESMGRLMMQSHNVDMAARLLGSPSDVHDDVALLELAGKSTPGNVENREINFRNTVFIRGEKVS